MTAFEHWSPTAGMADIRREVDAAFQLPNGKPRAVRSRSGIPKQRINIGIVLPRRAAKVRKDSLRSELGGSEG